MLGDITLGWFYMERGG